MPIPNRDIFPTEETLALYPGITCLTANPLIQSTFAKYEKTATRAKRSYHFWGTSTIFLVTVSVSYSIAYTIFDFHTLGQTYISFFFIACAVFALVIQLYLRQTKRKEIWLVARYAAERIRSIKFQGMSLGACAVDSEALEKSAASFYKSRLTNLENEIANGGIAALRSFVPHEAIKLEHPKGRPPNPDLYAETREAFRALRLEYQEKFAESQLTEIESPDKIWEKLADFFFISGIFLVLLTVISNIFLDIFPANVGKWLEFLSFLVFVFSSALSILENASIARTSRQRYQEYFRNLEKTRIEIDAAKLELNVEIERSELLSLRELQEFCMSALLISFRI